MSRRVVVALSAVALGACRRHDLLIDDYPPPPCEATLAVTVSAGTQPAIDWRPVCSATGVLVAPAAGGPAPLPLWQVDAPLLPGVAPPVRVGGSPRGAQVFGAGASLELGAVYTVYVTRGRRGAAGAGVDSVTFTARASP